MKWSFFGQRPKTPAPSWIALVLAFFFASQTFIDSSSGYPSYMIWLAFASSIWFTYSGFRNGAIMSVLFPLAGSMWLAPVLGWNDFTQMDVLTFSSHATLAVLFGIAGYTFAASERRAK
jgi:hypothetical protein